MWQPHAMLQDHVEAWCIDQFDGPDLLFLFVFGVSKHSHTIEILFRFTEIFLQDVKNVSFIYEDAKQKENEPASDETPLGLEALFDNILTGDPNVPSLSVSEAVTLLRYVTRLKEKKLW